MFNLNEKYFPISERCGRNHQNKILFTSPKETFSPWELNFRWKCVMARSAKSLRTEKTSNPNDNPYYK